MWDIIFLALNIVSYMWFGTSSAVTILTLYEFQLVTEDRYYTRPSNSKPVQFQERGTPNVEGKFGLGGFHSFLSFFIHTVLIGHDQHNCSYSQPQVLPYCVFIQSLTTHHAIF